jgi:quinol monooxygenase YgiN
MITRLVKLTIDDSKIEVFKSIFKNNQKHIQASSGCEMAEVFQDLHNPSIFFTHSKWESEDNLNEYRNSDLFKGIWKETKATFSSPPEVWSLH